VASAIATGSLAAASVVQSLLAEDTAQRDHRHERDQG
jgi:hypothetical protein